MSRSIRNSIGLRRQMEKLGIGLNAAGSYVLASLDADELDHLKQVNFAAIAWQPEEWVLQVNGSTRSGTLVRFVQLSPDHRYCRFPGRFRYVSQALVRAVAIPKKAFVAAIAGNQTLRIKKFNDVERVGILVGERSAKYKSLITLANERLLWVDIEENPPPQSSSGTTAILEDNPAAGGEIRDKMLQIFR